MAHGNQSFTLKLKIHTVKLFHKRFNQEILKLTRFANHRNNPLISTKLLFFFFKIMTFLVVESHLKIQCKYVLLKTWKYFCWISL